MRQQQQQEAANPTTPAQVGWLRNVTAVEWCIVLRTSTEKSAIGFLRCVLLDEPPGAQLLIPLAVFHTCGLWLWLHL
jgi:hypothetical protein